MMLPDDEVDLLIDGWARIMPEIDFTPLDVMSRLRRVSRHLTALRRESFSRVGLSISEFDVLASLRRAAEPYEMSPAELIRATMSSSAAMATRLAALDRRELITRRRNPDDSRSNLARLTDEGRRLVETAMVELVKTEANELSAISPEQQIQLTGLLRQLSSPHDD